MTPQRAGKEREPMVTFGELCCEVCGALGSDVAMHRANPKGEKGRWRCESCLDKPADPGVLTVTDWFETDNMLRSEGLPPLDLDDSPMTPEQVAWVRSQRREKPGG